MTLSQQVYALRRERQLLRRNARKARSHLEKALLQTNDKSVLANVEGALNQLNAALVKTARRPWE
jgi:hypothetical protein